MDWHRCEMGNGHSTFRCISLISPFFLCCCRYYYLKTMRKYEIPITEIQCSLLLLTYYRFCAIEVALQHFNNSSFQRLYIYKNETCTWERADGRFFLSLVRCWMFLACEPCNRHWFANNDAISERNWEIIGTTGRLHTHTHTFFYSKCVIFFLYFSPHISNSNVSCTWSCKCINQTIIARLNENNVYTFSITNCRLIWYFAAFNSLEALSIVRFAMTFQETGYWRS